MSTGVCEAAFFRFGPNRLLDLSLRRYVTDAALNGKVEARRLNNSHSRIQRQMRVLNFEIHIKLTQTAFSAACDYGIPRA